MSSSDSSTPSTETPDTVRPTEATSSVTSEAKPAESPVPPSAEASAEVKEKTEDKKDAPQDANGNTPPPENKGHRGRWVGLALVVFLAGGALGGYYGAKWMVYQRPLPFKVPVASDLTKNSDTATQLTNADGDVLQPTDDMEHPHFAIIRVTDGDTSIQVAEKLRQAGYDFPNWLMKVAAKLHPNHLAQLHKGRYKFSTTLTPAQLLDVLGKGAMIEGSIRIPEGATIWEVRKRFNEAPGLVHQTAEMSNEALVEALGIADWEALAGQTVKSPEGFLAPDTYRYAEGVTDLAVMKLALSRQQKLLTDLWAKRSADVKLTTPYEALILASIVEKESGLEADRPKIASVFHNRLEKQMPLQTDPTVIYGIGPNFNGNITKKDLDTATPYNTYKIPALPPTPIGTPGVTALKATLNPEETKYLYFVSRGDGSSEFSTNLKDHNRAVNRYILKAKPAAKSAADKTTPPKGSKPPQNAASPKADATPAETTDTAPSTTP